MIFINNFCLLLLPVCFMETAKGEKYEILGNHTKCLGTAPQSTKHKHTHTHTHVSLVHTLLEEKAQLITYLCFLFVSFMFFCEEHKNLQLVENATRFFHST